MDASYPQPLDTRRVGLERRMAARGQEGSIMALKHLVPLGVRNFLRPTYQWAYAPIHRMTQSHAQWKQLRAELAEWERKGRPVPPPHIVKQQALRQYAARYNLHVLVETGTYNGDMVEAMRAVFDRIYSIELSKELYEKARSRFRGVAHIELMHGDSGSELKGIMSALCQPTLFWLDGHYSAGVTARGAKDTPIFEELNHILTSTDLGHVIIIDDARCFGTEPAYPSIKELCDYIKSHRSNVDIVIKDDSIRIIPLQIAE